MTQHGRPIRASKAQAEIGLTKKALSHQRSAVARSTLGNPAHAEHIAADAEELAAAGIVALTLPDKPQIGLGGELHMSPADANYLGFGETMKNPDFVTAEASLQRLELAHAADCLELAADAAETIGASNSVEKMIAHQLAAGHALAMRFVARSLSHAKLSESPHLQSDRRTTHAIEATRFATAASRMMAAFSDAVRTLERLRNGGRQTVVVQHVNVGDGGQAVVAGKVESGKKQYGGGDDRL